MVNWTQPRPLLNCVPRWYCICTGVQGNHADLFHALLEGKTSRVWVLFFLSLKDAIRSYSGKVSLIISPNHLPSVSQSRSAQPGANGLPSLSHLWGRRGSWMETLLLGKVQHQLQHGKDCCPRVQPSLSTNTVLSATLPSTSLIWRSKKKPQNLGLSLKGIVKWSGP